MAIVKTFIALGLVIFLAGCVTPGSKEPIFLLPPGSEIQLNRDITAPRGPRIYIQASEVVPRDLLDEHAPHCQFYVERSATELRKPLTIETDKFTVTRSFHQADMSGLEGVQFASMDSNRSLSTVMELAPAQGLSGLRFVCSRLGSKSRDGFVTLDQMQDTLVGVVNLVPAS